MANLLQNGYPSFPIDVPTAQLSKISLEKLELADKGEREALCESCKTSGFFLLDLSTTSGGVEILQDVGKVFDMAQALFNLDLEDKVQYSMRPGRAYG